MLRYIANHIGDSISKLKDFAVKIRRNETINTDEDTQFSNDELGFISSEIIQLYQQLRKTKTELVLEKEKLISHLFVLNEGVAFFSPQKQVILNHSHFIFYINNISEESTISAEHIFRLNEFQEINLFIDKTVSGKDFHQLSELPRMEYSVQRDGSYFLINASSFRTKASKSLSLTIQNWSNGA